MKRATLPLVWIACLSLPVVSFADRLTDDHRLNPPVFLALTTPTKASYVTPMSAATTMQSAMVRGDYNTWLHSWEAKEKRARLERDLKAKRDPSFWVKIWAKSFPQEKIRYVRTATYQGYALIGYESVAASGKVTLRSALVFKQVSKGDWRATQDLAADPVCQKFP